MSQERPEPLRIGPHEWVALPHEVLPRCEFGGGITHVIYTASVYVSVNVSVDAVQELPAMVIITQTEYAALLQGQR